MKLDKFDEQVFFTTARIQVPYVDKDGQPKVSIGTGFFMQVEVNSHAHMTLLVSNKHVFVGRGQTALISIHKAEKADDDTNGGKKPDLKTNQLCTVPLADSYYEHPDPDIDLACVSVNGMNNENLNLFFKTLPYELFRATFEEDWLNAGSTVRFIGYPDGRYDTANNLPILRNGIISTIPSINYGGKKQFVVDGHIHQGSSGSPVFAVPPFGGKIKFVGVMTQTMIKGERLQPISDAAITTEDNGINVTLGLGLVLKPELIDELFACALAGIPKAELDKVNELAAAAEAQKKAS